MEDHCEAIQSVLMKAEPGETYNIGGCSERTNLSIVEHICSILDRIQPRQDGKSYADQIRYVTDRQGHDFRYAIDITKIHRELGWRPKHQFEQGLEETINWYLSHTEWVEHVRTGEYHKWLETNYKERLR